jgi:hypothetical protein
VLQELQQCIDTPIPDTDLTLIIQDGAPAARPEHRDAGAGDPSHPAAHGLALLLGRPA